jgi:hypothetical protein
MRILLLAAVLFSSAAWAQRAIPIPPDAKAADMTVVEGAAVQIDRRPAQLAPGARIRDPWNRTIPIGALPPESRVKYRVDGSGAVLEVWILSPQEAAESR